MKVLYLIYGPQSGVVSSLKDALNREGVEVDFLDALNVISYRHPKYRILSLRLRDICNVFFSIYQFRKDWRFYFKFTPFAFDVMSKYMERKLEKLVKNNDVILQSGALFGLINNKPPVPYCLYIDHVARIDSNYTHIEGLPSPLNPSERWFSREEKVYQNATKIFTLSENVKRALIKFYNINSSKVIVVGAGPNIPINQIPERKRYDGKTILFVGKNFPLKGGFILLKAFEKVKKQIPNSRLIIVGSEVKESMPGVVSKGVLDSSELPALYRDASIFALPTFREAFGISFVEAMHYKVPCIGTNIEAIPEIIEDGKTGFLIKPGNFHDLADKVITLLSNPELMEKMGETAYEKAKKHFIWEWVATKMHSEFKSLTNTQLSCL